MASELDAVIAEIRLLAEAALLRRLNAGSGFADPRVPSQIYLRDPAALARLAGGQLRPQQTHAKAAGEIAVQLARSKASSARLELMANRLAIDPAGRVVLAIAVAYALDLDTRELCHALSPRRQPALYIEVCADLIPSGPPTSATAAAMCRAVMHGSALRRGRVAIVDGDGLDAKIELAPAALAWLLGDDALQAPIANIAELIRPGADLGVVLPAGATSALDALVPRLRPDAAGSTAWPLDPDDSAGEPGVRARPDDVAGASGTRTRSVDKTTATHPRPDDTGTARTRTQPDDATGPHTRLDEATRTAHEPGTAWPLGPDDTTPGRPDARTHGQPVAVVLRGPRGSGRRAAAHRLAKALGRPLFVIPVPALVALELRAKSALLGLALAAARLRDAVPFLADADALFDDQGNLTAEHADVLAHHPGVVLAGSARSSHLELRRPALAVAIPRAELDDRERAWAAALGAVTVGAADATKSLAEAGELAGRYVIGPGAIADVVGEAKRHAAAAGTPVDVATLEAAVGRRLALRLGTFGTVVARKSRFAELVLPEDVIDTLHDMIAMVRERSQILERWGYQRHLGISRGVSGLYSGEPGTGKTMAASVVASELGLELVRIDLSAVVSKYVGETEKNLAKIFDEAQDAHAMLLFDEADSLFGKRTKLETAQDRFANLEVNYILQRMETFDGVSVLTTNAEAAIDPALQRRLNFRIRFPEPEVDERARLWRQLLPPSSGLHDRVDFHALGERFDMTGGYIKNAVVRAAVIAARAGRGMVAEDLWLGAHHEYVEMGKVMPQPSKGSL